jgi:hypothetical protein
VFAWAQFSQDQARRIFATVRLVPPALASKLASFRAVMTGWEVIHAAVGKKPTRVITNGELAIPLTSERKEGQTALY